MRSIQRTAVYLVAAALLAPLAHSAAGAEALDRAIQRQVLDELGREIEQRYVFPDKGEQAVAEVLRRLEAGDYDGLDAETFGKRATETLRAVADDRHLRLRYRPLPQAQPGPVDLLADDVRRAVEADSLSIVPRVEVLDGNVGYLEVATFADPERFEPAVTAALELVAHTDAIIVDVRRNGGGAPRSVRYLSSYFLPAGAPLNGIYSRSTGVTEEFDAPAELPGRRLDHLPLYILTSSKTASGAEGFAYNFKANRHGTVIGEVTWGGAQPGDTVRLGHGFEAFLANGRAVHPLTGTNWERVGVEPDMEMDAEAAYAEAVARAYRAAAERQERRTADAAAWITGLESGLATGADELRAELERGLEAGLVGERQVNFLGYGFIEAGEPALAEAVLRLNRDRFPDSPNVHDSYGDALDALGRLDQALVCYRRAVALAEAAGDPRLDAFRANLERAETEAREEATAAP